MPDPLVPHLGSVTLDVSLSDLRSIDELPFTYAINANVDMIMTSWATYPALDPNLPSGLSPRIVLGELRGRLKFRGVTITDAIEAGALQNFGDTGQRAVGAAAAGMDIVLCSARDLSQGPGRGRRAPGGGRRRAARSRRGHPRAAARPRAARPARLRHPPDRVGKPRRSPTILGVRLPVR